MLQSRLSVCSDGLLQTIQTPSKCFSIQSPIVLEVVNQNGFHDQIRGITNIANPKDSQFEDSSNRMLKLELTDGVTSCYAIEFARVPSLSATLKSGTKLSVSNVRVENGYLLLNPSNTFLLGGCASFLVSTNTPSYSRNNELKVSTVRVLAERRRCLKSRQRQNPVDHSFVEKCIAKSVTLPTYYNRRRSLP